MYTIVVDSDGPVDLVPMLDVLNGRSVHPHVPNVLIIQCSHIN